MGGLVKALLSDNISAFNTLSASTTNFVTANFRCEMLLRGALLSSLRP